MTLTAFLAAWFLHLIAAASPGPTILMSARIGVSEGMRTGFLFSLGCAIGALFWAVAALFGLAVLCQIAPTVLWGSNWQAGCSCCGSHFRCGVTRPTHCRRQRSAQHRARHFRRFFSG